VTRWTRRLLVGAIAILVPALAGCEAGQDAPTLQYHSASNGVSTTVNGIELDNVFVLGPALNQTLPAGGQAGLFLALSAQNHDQLVSASAPGTASSVQLLTGPVTLSPGALVNLSGPAPDIVLNNLTNPLSGGETVRLVLNFATAGVVTLMVPVQPAAYDYATFSPPPSPSATATP
jgi:copper(I)-binding protein